jgi:hypothetical protein
LKSVTEVDKMWVTVPIEVWGSCLWHSTERSSYDWFSRGDARWVATCKYCSAGDRQLY